MDRRTFLKTVPVAAATVLTAAELTAAQTTELKPIELVKPEMEGGKSVLASLKIRQTNRNIKPEPLTPQEMSNLMWAAFGINREQFRGKTGRTAASASNSQEIDLYVALPEGVYVYDAAGHKLTPVVAGDFRSRAGRDMIFSVRRFLTTTTSPAALIWPLMKSLSVMAANATPGISRKSSAWTIQSP